MGAGEGSGLGPLHQANGMGIPGSGGWWEGIYCGILQRTLEQGGYYQFKTNYLPPQEIKIKLHMAQDFLLVLPLFVISSESAEFSVRSWTVFLNTCGFDLIGTSCNDPC